MNPLCSNIQAVLYGGWKKEIPDMRFAPCTLLSK